MQATGKIDFDIHLFEITLFLIDNRIYLLNNSDLALQEFLRLWRIKH